MPIVPHNYINALDNPAQYAADMLPVDRQEVTKDWFIENMCAFPSWVWRGDDVAQMGLDPWKLYPDLDHDPRRLFVQRRDMPAHLRTTKHDPRPKYRLGTVVGATTLPVAPTAVIYKEQGRTWAQVAEDAKELETLRAENTLLRARIEQAPIQDYTAEDAPIPSNDPVVLAELVLLPVDRLIERLLGIYDLYPGQCAPRRFYVGAINHAAALKLDAAITLLEEVRKFVDDYGNWHKRIDEVIK